MATQAERNAYASRLRAIARNVDSIERALLQDSIRLLRDVRDQIAGQLTATEFSQFRIAEQTRILDDIIGNYDAQIRFLTANAAREAFVLGERSVIEPLQQANIGVAFFRPSTAQINVISQFSADLISGISSDMRTKMNRVIRLNALGGNTSLDAMRDITNLLFKTQRPPSPRTRRPTRGVAYEAERILRTEVNRSYNLAAFGQQEALARDVPGLQKMWQATGDIRTRDTHLLAHGQVVLVNEFFRVGFSDLMFPLDPSGPPGEVINCRCRSVTVLPEIGVIETPLDARIQRELRSRDLVPT